MVGETPTLYVLTSEIPDRLPRRFKPDDTYASRSSFAQELATKLYSADYLRSPYSEKDVELILGEYHQAW